MPYIRYITLMYPAVAGESFTSADQDPPEYPSYAAGRIPFPPGPSRRSGNAAAPVPHAMYPTSTTRMRINAIWRRLMWVTLQYVRPSRSLGCPGLTAELRDEARSMRCQAFSRRTHPGMTGPAAA